MTVGLAQARIAALSALAARAAESSPPSSLASRLNLAIRDLGAGILRDMREAFKEVALSPDTATLFKDMEKSGTIAGNVARIRQEQDGERLLQPMTVS